MTPSCARLGRRALAELIGTALLVTAVVGSGIAASRLSPHDVGLELFENAVATGAALVAIILAVGPVSGAHLNPAIVVPHEAGDQRRRCRTWPGGRRRNGTAGDRMPELVSRRGVHTELEGARTTFHRLVEGATATELRRPSDGIRWTNEELLFHMLFGYLIVRVLLVLARLASRLPNGASRRFAALLNSATALFDEVNFYGSRIGAWLVSRRRMDATFDRVIASLHRGLAAEAEADLRRGMYYPVRWDPFFKEFMTVADIYHYPSQHFDFHRRQLTLTGAQQKES